MTDKPKDLDKEAADFFKKEDDQKVDELYEALKIDQIIKQMAGYLKNEFLTPGMPLMEALEKLEKKKFELIGMDPNDAEEAPEDVGDK